MHTLCGKPDNEKRTSLVQKVLDISDIKQVVAIIALRPFNYRQSGLVRNLFCVRGDKECRKLRGTAYTSLKLLDSCTHLLMACTVEAAG